MKVNRSTLLLLAGLVWSAAGLLFGRNYVRALYAAVQNKT